MELRGSKLKLAIAEAKTHNWVKWPALRPPRAKQTRQASWLFREEKK